MKISIVNACDVIPSKYTKGLIQSAKQFKEKIVNPWTYQIEFDSGRIVYPAGILQEGVYFETALKAENNMREFVLDIMSRHVYLYAKQGEYEIVFETLEDAFEHAAIDQAEKDEPPYIYKSEFWVIPFRRYINSEEEYKLKCIHYELSRLNRVSLQAIPFKRKT